MCLIFGNAYGHFKESNGNKYLTLVPTNESKEKKKKYKELWIKIWDLIRSIIKKLYDYGEKYMKIKFDWDVNLPLNKAIEIPIETIVIYKDSKKNLYVYLSQKWHHIEKTLMKLSNVSFLIKDDKLLEKYKEILGKFENSFKKEFVSEPMYNKKNLKAKIKSYNGKINTNFPRPPFFCNHLFFCNRFEELCYLTTSDK